MRKVEIGNATLYNGDCREVIPTLTSLNDGTVTVISDLPYGIEDLTGGYGRAATTIMNDKNLDVPAAALDLIVTIFTDIRILVFYSCRITDRFFACAGKWGNYVGELIWDKKMPGLTGQGAALRYMHENIAIFEHGKPAYPMGETFSIISDARAPKLHPHQKPQLLMETLVKVAGGDIVFDPFMGSGSTGVAALRAGKRFIGIELDPKHFETAVARITEADASPGLW